MAVPAAWSSASQTWPFEVTDHREKSRIVILVYGDGGTGEAGQYRVGHAMAEVCAARGCDFGIALGDNIYENGIEVRHRDSAAASHREILDQFDRKFAQPYAGLAARPGFQIWIAAGNHDYEHHAFTTMVTYSQFSALWRFPATHYGVPQLPRWLQVEAVHTDTDVRRDLNGLQVAALRRTLCTEGAERWKFAFGHQPVYNSGHHRGDGDERRTRALLEPVLADCGVHVYFAGHAHHQEHLTARGFEQVIQGAAGKSKGGNRPPRVAGVRQRYFSRTFGFAIVDVSADRVRMDFYDVLNTRERAGDWTSPAEGEIVQTYSWCAARADVGRADRDVPACAAR